VEFTEELLKWSPLLKTKENGLPVVDFSTFAFIDEYHPKVRDRILEEIEQNEPDDQYKDDLKRLGFQNLDDVVTHHTMAMMKEAQSKQEKEVLKSFEKEEAETPKKKKELLQMFKDVQEKAERIKKIRS